MFQFKQISPNIQKSLFKRIDALNRENEMKPLEPRALDNSKHMDEMFTKSCWAKVTSAVPELDNDGKKVGNKLFRISSAFKDNQPLNKPLTSKQSLFTNDPLATFRPHSGIQSISTSFKNHSIQNIEISWKFWDINEFNKYENALLKHGRVVLVEFGWAKNDIINVNQQQVQDTSDMLQIFRATNKQIKEAGGDYYCAMGKITSFNYKINEQGGFDCTTTLTSMGSTLFKGQIDDVNTKVPESIATNNSKKLEEAYSKSNLYFEKFMENLDKNIELDVKDGAVGVYYDGEKGYCNWAWFEDTVLNTFFGWTTESGDALPKEGNDDYGNPNEPMLTSVLSKDVTFEMGKDNNKVEKSVSGPTKCRSSKNLFTNSIDIVLPKKTAGLSSIKSNGKTLSGDVGSIMNDKFEGTETLKDYISLFEKLKELNDEFPAFEEDGKGIIRNFVFSSDMLKHHFGGGVRDLESALNSFWNSVSGQYGGYWDFGVVVSTNNNGQIGVVDNYTTEFRVKDVNPELDMTHTMSKERDCNRTFVFRNYGKNSLLKSFDVEVNLSSAQATMAMFHGNKKIGTKGNTTTNKPEDIGVAALAKLQNVEMGGQEGSDKEPRKDTVLKEITHPFLENKIAKRVNIKDQDSGVKLVESKGELKKSIGDKSPEEIQKELESQKQSEKQINDFNESYNWFDSDNPQNAGLIYNPDGSMINSYEKSMNYLLTKSVESRTEVDPLVPLGVSFTIPGIGGIDLYDMFAIDYLPENYRRFALFQVSGMDHSLDSSGWTTSITGQMRIDMDGLEAATGKIVEEEDIVVDTTVGKDKSINFIDLTFASSEEEKESE